MLHSSRPSRLSRAFVVALVLIVGCSFHVPGAGRAQWGGDPAQRGATVYCDAIRSGRSPADAERAAVQVMQQLLALAEGTLVIQQTVLPLSLVERWGSLVGDLCPVPGSTTDHGLRGF